MDRRRDVEVDQGLLPAAVEQQPGDVEHQQVTEHQADLLAGAGQPADQHVDAEIGAHLGEVLWSLGQRDQAQAIWREGMLINSENETLMETLKRLKVKP